jgi:hypothetical protein
MLSTDLFENWLAVAPDPNCNQSPHCGHDTSLGASMVAKPMLIKKHTSFLDSGVVSAARLAEPLIPHVGPRLLKVDLWCHFTSVALSLI